MPFSKITLTFNNVPEVNQYLEFSESVTALSLKETFKPTRSTIKQCKLPAGFNAGTEGDPDIVYSGWVSANYKTAFNLDYNAGGAYYDVVVTNGPAGSGIGTVEITAKFPNAVFAEVNTPGAIDVLIENETYVETISIDSVSVSSGSSPCENVTVEVTTNILATKITSPVSIDPNTDNPFTLTISRGTTATISVSDADDNTDSQSFTAPPLLDADAFTVTINNNLTGATAIVEGTIPGLNLFYSIDGFTFTSSNTFTGLEPGDYTVIIADQYGCGKAKLFTVDEIQTPVILSRSPYNVVIEAPGTDFDKAVLDLRIWTGHKSTDYPLLPTYSLSKYAVQAGQEKIAFNISDIVNGYVKAILSAFGSTGSFPTSVKESVWIETDITATYLGEEVGSEQRLYLAVDGYGYHTEGSNPIINGKVLSSVTDHIIYSGNYPLYFLTEGLESITINGSSIPFTYSQSTSNQVVGYVNAALYAGSSEHFTAVFVYGDQMLTHHFTKKTECKFPVMNCIFKNKFGYWQTIPFNRLSRKGIDRSSSEYQASISDFGDYSLNDHTVKNYQVNAKQKVTVNTDFIPETYNALFTELMLSEFVYLEENGVTLPVNLSKENLDYKTKRNDKLIQYTMEFKYSFDLINNVR